MEHQKQGTERDKEENITRSSWRCLKNFPHPSTAEFEVEQYVVVEIVDTTGLAAGLSSIEEKRHYHCVSACIYLRVYVEAHAWGAWKCDRDTTPAGRDSSRMAHGW